MGDEIVEDVVTTKTGNDIRLERRGQGQIKSRRPLARRRLCRLWQNLFADGAQINRLGWGHSFHDQDTAVCKDTTS